MIRTQTLLVGFDSAWTPNNSGAIVGVLHISDGTFRETGPPQIADYEQAEAIIANWQAEFAPAVFVMLAVSRASNPRTDVVGSISAP